MGEQVSVVTAPVALAVASASKTGDQIRSALAISRVVVPMRQNLHAIVAEGADDAIDLD
jgi:hypothetical protein